MVAWRVMAAFLRLASIWMNQALGLLVQNWGSLAASLEMWTAAAGPSGVIAAAWAAWAAAVTRASCYMVKDIVSSKFKKLFENLGCTGRRLTLL
jgi:hypothetical protein